MDSIAAADQMLKSATRQMAQTAAAFRTELITAGFTVEAAEQMVIVWMDHVLEGWCDDSRDV